MMSNLNLRPMTDPEIKYWYTEEFKKDFNLQERKPLSDIIGLRNSGHYDLLGLFSPIDKSHPEKMIGYATIWKSPNIELLLLDYLGVSSTLRNKGFGSQILSFLKIYYKDQYIVVESEFPVPGDNPKENYIREHRINFYKRNRFEPVYEMATCGMRWQALLFSTTSLDSSKISQIMHDHKTLYGPSRTDVKIPLGLDETPDMPYWMLEKEY